MTNTDTATFDPAAYAARLQALRHASRLLCSSVHHEDAAWRMYDRAAIDGLSSTDRLRREALAAQDRTRRAFDAWVELDGHYPDGFAEVRGAARIAGRILARWEESDPAGYEEARAAFYGW